MSRAGKFTETKSKLVVTRVKVGVQWGVVAHGYLWGVMKIFWNDILMIVVQHSEYQQIL